MLEVGGFFWYSLADFGEAENRFLRANLDGGGKSEHQRARCRVTGSFGFGIHAGSVAERRADGQCHRKQTARSCLHGRVRVKRRGKSPPLGAQAHRHGKPHRVQGQIGDPGVARSMFRSAKRVPGTGCSDKWFSPRQNREDRIRLTASPKSRYLRPETAEVSVIFFNSRTAGKLAFP